MSSSTRTAWFVLLSSSYFVLSHEGNGRITCSPGFITNEVSGAKYGLFCFRLFSDKASWENARQNCMDNFSFLLDSEFFNTTDLQRFLTETKGLKFIWVGIKRVSGFYAWQTSSSRIFRETDNWGNKWQDDDTLVKDCVALDVGSGNLFTESCAEKHRYICINNGFSTKPVQLPLCPHPWIFTYLLNVDSDRCIRIYPKSTFDESKKICEENDGLLITPEDYHGLYYVLEDKFLSSEDTLAYWVDVEVEPDGSVKAKTAPPAKMTWKISETTDSLPVICKRPLLKIDIIASIFPTELESFPSSEDKLKFLTCEVSIAGKRLGETEQQFVSYQWMKNGLPLRHHDRTIDLSLIEDDTKQQQRLIFNQQGNYQCQGLIAGAVEYVTSQEVEIYFSDVSTYIIVIESKKFPYNSSQDISRLGFQQFIDNVQPSVNSVINKFKSGNISNVIQTHPIYWDFQRISIIKKYLKATILLYLKWSKSDEDQRLQNEDSVKAILMEIMDDMMNNKIMALFPRFWYVKSAGICTSELSDEVNWLQTPRTKNAISSPLCFNEYWQLNKRICKGDLNEGAHWEKPPACDKVQDAIESEDFIQCSSGYTPFISNMCYKIYMNEETWDEAFSSCSRDYSFLFSYNDDDINWNSSINTKTAKELDSLGEFWAAGTLRNGIFQWIGIAPRPLEESSVLKWDKDEPKEGNDCVSVYNVSGNDYVARSRNCNEKRKFVCIQHNVTLSKLPSCDKGWEGTVDNENCFMFVEQSETWEEAQKLCGKINPRSHLLTLPDLETYKLIKWRLSQANANTSKNWWIGLRWNGHEYQWNDPQLSGLTFVDWIRNVQFSGENSVAALVVSTSWGELDGIKWNLFPPWEKNSYICEMRRSKNPPKASAEISSEDYLRHIQGIPEAVKVPKYTCITKNSLYRHHEENVIWYKDGIPVENKWGNHWSNKYCILCNADNTSFLLRDLVRSQGYYQCSTMQEKPFQYVTSYGLLYQTKGIKTFIVTMFSTYNFSESNRDMKKGKYLKTSSIIENEIGDVLKDLLFVTLKKIIPNINQSELLFHFYDTRSLITSETEVFDDESKKLIEGLFIRDDLDDVHANVKQWILKYEIIRESITVESTALCPESVTFTSKGDVLTWPRTPVGHSAITEELCLTDEGLPLVRRCLQDFNTGAHWADVHGDCHYDENQLTLEKLAKRRIDENNVLNTSRSLSHMSSKSDLNITDVHFIATVLSNIANVKVTSSEVVEKVTMTINNVLGIETNILETAQDVTNSSSRIVQSLERILLNSDLHENELTIVHSRVAIQTWKLRELRKNPPVGVVSSSADNTTEWHVKGLFNISTLYATEVLAGILLPLHLIQERSEMEEKLNFIIYQEPLLFSKINGFKGNITVNSPVIYASVGTESVLNINPPVQIIMEQLNVDLMNRSTLTCAYLKRNLHSSSESWSNEGCTFQGFQDNRYLCYCNHLTNFAVLTGIDFSEDKDKIYELSLSIITYIGCALSIFGLIMTILTFILFKKWRKGNKNQTLCNLSVALLSSLVIFVFGINRTNTQLGCTIVAVFLHYFLLASFAWMVVEAVLQYLNFVKVLLTYIPRFMRKAMILAWGLPLGIVTIVLAIDPGLYNSRSNYCWLSTDAFYYAFAMPVSILLVTNFVIFCIIIYSINSGRKTTLRTNQDERKQVLARLRAAVCIYFLLGLSWSFGFLAIKEARLAFQYLFALTSTIQGFFIFLFFVLRERTARQMWYDLFFSSKNNRQAHTAHSRSDLSLAEQRRVK